MQNGKDKSSLRWFHIPAFTIPLIVAGGALNAVRKSEIDRATFEKSVKRVAERRANFDPREYQDFWDAQAAMETQTWKRVSKDCAQEPEDRDLCRMVRIAQEKPVERRGCLVMVSERTSDWTITDWRPIEGCEER